MPPTAPAVAEGSPPASQGVIMLMSQIGVVNYSTIPDAEVARWAAASSADAERCRADLAPARADAATRGARRNGHRRWLGRRCRRCGAAQRARLSRDV